jgi:hypothetical protein
VDILSVNKKGYDIIKPDNTAHPHRNVSRNLRKGEIMGEKRRMEGKERKKRKKRKKKVFGYLVVLWWCFSVIW